MSSRFLNMTFALVAQGVAQQVYNHEDIEKADIPIAMPAFSVKKFVNATL